MGKVLNESQRALLGAALQLAREQYSRDAAIAAEAQQPRIAAQFHRQERDAENLQAWVEDAMEVRITL
jgi:hypothetical protein